MNEYINKFKILCDYNPSKGLESFNVKYYHYSIITEEIEQINELNLNRIADYHLQHGFGIISAGIVNAEGNMDKETLLLNKENNIKLKNDILSAGFNYTPVQGGYVYKDGKKGTESAFFIYPKNNEDTNEKDTKSLYNFLLSMSKKYNQETFLFAKDGKAVYYTQNGDIDMEFNGKLSYNNLTHNYFTQIQKPGNNKNNNFTKLDKRFTFENKIYYPKYPHLPFDKQKSNTYKNIIFP